MIVVVGSVQAEVRIDMTMPKAPDSKAEQGGGVSPWEREAYGEGGRFGSMQMMPSGDPSKDRISVHYCGCGYHVAGMSPSFQWWERIRWDWLPLRICSAAASTHLR